MAAIAQAKKFLTRNKEKLEKELKEIDKQIAELQRTKVSISHFLKLFDAVNGDGTTATIETVRTMVAEKITPLSLIGINIAKTLAPRSSFRVDDIHALVQVHDKAYTKQDCYSWLGAWKTKSWIDTVLSGEYKFKQCFFDQVK